MSLTARLRRMLESGELDLPPIGDGATAARWRALHAIARRDLSVGRLAEAHVDAVQILGEAGVAADPARLCGVWASEHPRHRVRAALSGGGRLLLEGTKSFSSGATLVNDALVTATTDDGPLLVRVAVDAIEPGRIDTSGWLTPALADTATATVDLTGIVVGAEDVIGPPGWYLDRPGFWHGAVGPAACWAGGAAGLVDHALEHPPDDPLGRAHLGAIVARIWSVAAVLDSAGREVDALDLDKPEPTAASRHRALTVRVTIDDACAEIQERFGRALGPRPLVADPGMISLDQALRVYRRQSHAERDMRAIGDLAVAARTPPP